jgi:DNA-directed RNA polymerase sigma subunit (sigma70/sigma32)
MIHPEFENIIDKFEFNKNGVIFSENRRVKYTIETCKIDRYDLNEKRKTIIDDFVESIIDKKLKKESINKTLQEFLNDFEKQEQEFIALRYWILKNYKSLVEEN